MEVKQIGNIMSTATRENTNQGRVYDSDGLCPTLNTMQGGGRQPHIMEIKAYDEQNDIVRNDGTVGTLQTDGSSPKHNNRVIEIAAMRGRGELCIKQNKERKSDRQRKDMPNTDNGEYP